MYVKITPQDLGVSKSCEFLVRYLEKENKGQNKEMFFNSSRNDIAPEEVIHSIDENTRGRGLKNNEARFYNIVVSPSSQELHAISDNPDKLKEYTRDIMKEYAASFNRKNSNGSPVTIDDLEWYAKVETSRSFSGNDKMVLHNEKFIAIKHELNSAKEISTIEQRMGLANNHALLVDELSERLEKMGGLYVINEQNRIEKTTDRGTGTIIRRGIRRPEHNQSHVHIIVSRCHKTERMSLSPMANNRGGKNKLNGAGVDIGFNRWEFARKCEVMYDMKFDYGRYFNQSISSKQCKNFKTGVGRDYYSNMLFQNVAQGYSLKFNIGSEITGQNQFALFMRQTINEKTGEKASDHFEKYVNNYYPANIVKIIDEKLEAIKSMKMVSDLTNVNLVAKAVKTVADTIVKSVTKSIYL